MRVVDTRHGRFMVQENDQYIGRSLIAYGEYSEAEWALLRHLIEPGAVAVEAGANIGALTVPLARAVGPAGRVFAFEPQRLVHQMLCGNLALNEIENTYALAVALGDRGGQVRMPITHYGADANFGGVSLANDTDRTGEAVAMGTIDALNLDRLDLLKVDVEGAEELVLHGAEATIRRLRPMLYLENDRRARSPALLSHVFALGYEVWWHLPPLFNPDNYRRNIQDIFGSIISLNILCRPKERAGGAPQDADRWKIRSVEDWPL